MVKAVKIWNLQSEWREMEREQDDEMAKGKYQKWLEPEGLTLIEGWARSGLTDEQIAHNMGISRETFYKWKSKYSDISDVLKKGKEIIDFEVENAMIKRALGYDATEMREEIEQVADGVIKKKKIKTTRHIPPDVTAQIFWLKNRRPDKWRDKPAEVIDEGQADDKFLKALEGHAQEDWADETD